MDDEYVKVVTRVEVTQRAEHDCTMANILIIDVADNDHWAAQLSFPF
jgi:hypothetical protein